MNQLHRFHAGLAQYAGGEDGGGAEILQPHSLFEFSGDVPGGDDLFRRPGTKGVGRDVPIAQSYYKNQPLRQQGGQLPGNYRHILLIL